ncbi:MAG: adenosylmethionine--8-amino-7-oxononanoate transaminase [Verrucomicrobia bacterium]|nr:adenosylmethionine--8-amino-7-oxononanoate transaminase [Cytophagales bacterium]
MTENTDWIEKDKTVVWHPFTPLTTSPEPLPVVSAEGCELVLADGRRIIDAIASWWVNLHGHAHPYIAQAIFEQAKKLEHVIFAGFTHQPAVTLATRLLEILPDNQSKIFYSDNGSTAVEVALKMAFQYWHNQAIPRKKVIAFADAYHGDTFGAMSVGGRSAFTAPFVPFLFEVAFIDFPTCNQLNCCAGSNNQYPVCQGVAFSLEKFTQLAISGEVAAFIFEPLVQGAAGMQMYAKEILDNMLAIAQANGIICIADEVMTGFGRTGKLFASHYLTHKPDIICLSKGLTGGSMALGVTSCTEAIIQAFRDDDLLKTFFHGHSFTANPIACAAANASLDLLLMPDCQANIQRITEKNQTFARAIAPHAKVREVRTLGVILAIEINTDQQTSYINEARHELYDYFLKKNILLRPLGNVIYLLPPYVISDEQLETVYEAIMQLLGKD